MVALFVAASVGLVACQRAAAVGAPSSPASPSSVGSSATPTAAPTVAVTSAGPAASTRPIIINRASRLHTLPPDTTQVVIVHGTSYTTTYATVEAYQKSGSNWVLAFPPMAARIGERGFSDNKKEGVPATPTGVYGFGPVLYGNSPNPGVHYPYHQFVVGDYWDENPDSPTYNTFVHGSNPGGASEALWHSPTAYSYFAFIAYNVPAVPGDGSGIFLHQSLNRYTAGCVALPRSDLLRVLTWLKPSANPRIVMAPDSVLGRY